MIDKILTLFMLTGLTISILSLSIIILENNAFAIDYSNYGNNKYGIEFYYYNITYEKSINHLIKDNSMIIPITAKFNSNQYKINSCAQSYHNTIPRIYRDDESYWEGSNIACAYGLYNYNVNIGDKNVDPLLLIEIEGGADLCMLDDRCMEKINKIIKGEIALQPDPSTPKLKDPNQSIPPKKSPEEEEQQLINFCAVYFYAIDQPQGCENLPADVKHQVQINAEKRQEVLGYTTTEKNSDEDEDDDKDKDDKDDDKDEDD